MDGRIITVPVRTAMVSVPAAMPALAVPAPTVGALVATAMRRATVMHRATAPRHVTVPLAATARVATAMRRVTVMHLAMARIGTANAVMQTVTHHAIAIRHVPAVLPPTAKAAAGIRRSRGAIGPVTASSPRALAAIVRPAMPAAKVPVGPAGVKARPVKSRARIATPAVGPLMASPLARGPAPAAHRTPSPASAAATARVGDAQSGKTRSLGACVRAGVGSVVQGL